MNHTFPDKVTTHKLSFTNGCRLNLLVAPNETYGKALQRAGYRNEDVESITLEDAPLHYEPDCSVASR